MPPKSVLIPFVLIEVALIVAFLVAALRHVPFIPLVVGFVVLGGINALVFVLRIPKS